jgi:hypothetical protein
MHKQNKPGYILITTLLLIMACSAIVARYVYKLSTIRFNAHAFETRQQASALALGCIDLVMDMLTPPEEKKSEEKKTEEKKDEGGYRVKRMLMLNKWRTFDLQEDIDGIDAQIKIFITDEQGKIALNQLYNFKDKKWQTTPVNGQKILDSVSAVYKNELKGISLTEQVSNFFKDYGKPLHDLSQFAKSKELQKISQRPSFLFDVFTVETQVNEINPLGLSIALQQLLGLKVPEKIEEKKLAEIIGKIPAQVNWQTQWDISLASFYGKRYNELPQEIKQLFGTSLDSTVYSVTIQVTVKSAFQQIYAVLIKDVQDNPVKPFLIKKLIWL